MEAACAEATSLGLSVLCIPEIVSALNRRLREHTLTRTQYASAKDRLVEEVLDAEVINLTTSVIATSVCLLEASPIRALDALQVACAVEWEADLFVSYDTRQLEAARRAGLKVRKA